MSTLVFVLGCAVVGIVVAFAMPSRYRPVSPIGETMPSTWKPHPRTVVVLDPDGAA